MRQGGKLALTGVANSSTTRHTTTRQQHNNTRQHNNTMHNTTTHNKQQQTTTTRCTTARCTTTRCTTNHNSTTYDSTTRTRYARNTQLTAYDEQSVTDKPRGSHCVFVCPSVRLSVCVDACSYIRPWITNKHAKKRWIAQLFIPQYHAKPCYDNPNRLGTTLEIVYCSRFMRNNCPGNQNLFSFSHAAAVEIMPSAQGIRHATCASNAKR